MPVPFGDPYGQVRFVNEEDLPPQERMRRLEQRIAELDDGNSNTRYDKNYRSNDRGAMRAREELDMLRAQYGYGGGYGSGCEDDECGPGCPEYGQSNQDCYECEQNCMGQCEQGAQYRFRP